MAFVLLAGDSDLCEKVHARHLAEFEVRIVPDLEAVFASRRLASCIVLCLNKVDRRDALSLERLTRGYPASRTVLVTHLSRMTVEALTVVPRLIDRVVWYGDRDEDLASRLRRLTNSTFLDIAAGLVVAAEKRPPPPGGQLPSGHLVFTCARDDR